MRYPAWWNKTVTVYNRYEDPANGMTTWYRNVIPNVFVKNVLTRAIAGDAEQHTQNSIVRIPRSARYTDPASWKTRENKSGCFTLQRGDIVVIGDVADEIDEYTKGKRSSDLIAKYTDGPGCFAIDFLSVNDFGSLAHYLLKG